MAETTQTEKMVVSMSISTVMAPIAGLLVWSINDRDLLPYCDACNGPDAARAVVYVRDPRHDPYRAYELCAIHYRLNYTRVELGAHLPSGRPKPEGWELARR